MFWVSTAKPVPGRFCCRWPVSHSCHKTVFGSWIGKKRTLYAPSHFPVGVTFRLCLLLVAENTAFSPNPLGQNSASHVAEAFWSFFCLDLFQNTMDGPLCNAGITVTFQEQFPHDKGILPQTCIINFAVGQGEKMTQSCSYLSGRAEFCREVSPSVWGHTLQGTVQKWAVTAGFAWLLGTTNRCHRLLQHCQVSLFQLLTYMLSSSFDIWTIVNLMNSCKKDKAIQIENFLCKPTYLK